MGVFITKGMGIRIPPGGLVIDPSGENTLTIHVSLDVWPHWLRLATGHVEAAERARAALTAASPDDAQAITEALEAEFCAGMQAVTCAAIAVDAFYASVKERIDLPHQLTLTWRKKKTARHRQVGEVLQRAFRIGAGSRARTKTFLRALYDLRDRAVHPSAAHEAPIMHDVLKMGTEWRFVVFRLEAAKNVSGVAISMIGQILELPRLKFPKLVTWVETAKTLIAEPLAIWERSFGRIEQIKTRRAPQM